MKFMYRMYIHCNNFFIRKSTGFQSIYVSDKKDENSWSTKEKCFKYNVQCSNVLRNTIKFPIQVYENCTDL